MNRTIYYAVGIPIVVMTLLYTSFVRRFIYMLPTFFGKLLFTCQPSSDGHSSIVLRILMCTAGLTLVLNNHFFSTAWDSYSLFAMYAVDLWDNGYDSLASLADATGQELTFAGARVIAKFSFPALHTVIAGLLIILSVGITLGIDGMLKD